MVYLTVKVYDENYRKLPPVHHIAPAGTPIEWSGGTNAGHEEHYGGTLLYWISLLHPSGTLYGTIGAELGADFEWDD